MNNLAGLLAAKGDYAGAEPLYRRALEARERTLGKEHPDTLGSVNDLAGLLASKGDYAGAEPLYPAGAGGARADAGAGASRHAGQREQPGRLACRAKATTPGRSRLYRRALEARERTLGKEHPDTLASVNNLAGLLASKGDYAGAEPLVPAGAGGAASARWARSIPTR